MARLKNTWCGFMEEGGNQVVINPLQVAMLRKVLDGTEIVFARGGHVIVTADVNSVQEGLFEREYDAAGNGIP